MPNWCNNVVEISHEDAGKMEALVAAVNEGKFCNFAIPVPKALTETVAGHLGDEYEQELNQFKMQLNKKYFGADTWYEFCTSNWGTKWDVDAYDTVVLEGNGVEFGFDSAWSPPTGVYDALVEQGFSVRAYYYEPGMGYCGKWEDGQDDYYDIGNMNSQEVRDMLPEDLDECMCISENMEMYEEENKDELEEFLEEGAEKKGLDKPATLKFD